MKKGSRKGSTLVCEECKRSFYAPPCAKRKFCSMPCYRESRKFTPERFWARVEKRGLDECWLWTAGRSAESYGRAFDGKRTRQAHDVAWELTNGTKLRRGRVVLHSCDNPPCCNPRHLSEGSPRDNLIDAIKKKRFLIPYLDFEVPLHRRPTGNRHGSKTKPESVLRGAAVGTSKLTESRVRSIRAYRERGHTLTETAKRFGVAFSHVHRIVTYQSWSHVK